jgi:hypothetical protein
MSVSSELHTYRPLEGTEFVSGGWGVWCGEELVGAAFGEHAQARAGLFVAALELSRKLNERAEPVEEGEDVQADFRCAIASKPVRAQSGQNEKCQQQCAHCRTLEEQSAVA